MTSKSKYPIYFNAGNVLLPYDPDKPFSKWIVIAMAFLTVGAIIIIIVALAYRSETIYDCWALSDLSNPCSPGTGIPRSKKTKTYTKDKEQDCCVGYDNGKCKGKDATVDETICTTNKFKIDCNNDPTDLCKWKSNN